MLRLETLQERQRTSNTKHLHAELSYYVNSCLQVALRWRTEGEVVSGAGQLTCGNTRCAHHPPAAHKSRQSPKTLVTLELPFAYVEEGERKSALVKVALCRRCQKKLTWKRDQEKLAAYASRTAEEELAKLDGRPGRVLTREEEEKAEEEDREIDELIDYDSQDDSDDDSDRAAYEEKMRDEERRRRRRSERRSASPPRRSKR